MTDQPMPPASPALLPGEVTTMGGRSMTGAELIAAERRRQIEAEGWSVEHDREHGAGRLVRAGHAYAGEQGSWWPFDNGRSFKPKGPLRNLVRAGALYQAAADVATETDTWSFATREKCESHRDKCAERIDALIAEVLAALGLAEPVGNDGRSDA